ncbi:MAG: DUF2130 domain-containing protein [Gemmatimonadaceae bacterium]
MNETEMHRRLAKLGAAAAEREAEKLRRQLDRQYRTQLAEQAAAIRKVAAKEALASSRHQIKSLQRSLSQAQRASRREAEAAAKQAAKEAAKLARKELDLLKLRTAKERAQYAADTGRLKAKVDDLSLKLERQTSEQMGEMAEADAFLALRRAFPHDDIQRVGRGVRGADILHIVMVEGNEAGRIIYECKNVSGWQNEWLAKARNYRAEYQTPWVVIASRCFPRREKWFVVERGVPVIDLRLIVKLAEVLRAAVVEIGQLRTSNIGRQAKAEQMFEYVRSDHFAGRFRGVAEAIATLRDHQGKERQWHTEAWAKQTRLYDEMDESRREISARIRAIAEATSNMGLRVVAGDG